MLHHVVVRRLDTLRHGSGVAVLLRLLLVPLPPRRAPVPGWKRSRILGGWSCGLWRLLPNVQRVNINAI